jgi:hypothetical protein
MLNTRKYLLLDADWWKDCKLCGHQDNAEQCQ